MVSFDFETYLIQPGLLAPPIVCGSDMLEGSEPHLYDKNTSLKQLEHWLNSDQIIVGQNIAYDFGCALASGRLGFALVWDAYRMGRVFDIGISATLNAIAEGRLHNGELYTRTGQRVSSGRYSLQLLVEEWLGRTNAKENDQYRLRYGELDGLPINQWPAEARQYPLDDARNTLEVALAQNAGPCENLSLVPFQSHVAFCLHLGAMWGIRCDPERVERFATSAQTELAELKEKFTKEKIYRFQGPKIDPKRKLVKDTKKLKELVSAAYGGQPPLTETGAVSTDRLTLEDSGDDLLEALAMVSKVEKQVSYLPSLREACRVPLNVRPNVMLSTGRSSYEGIIQLLPRKGPLRPCFRAREGYCFISVDFSAVELSTLAQTILDLGIESRLAAAINADMDPHCMLAADLANVTYEEFIARKKEVDFAELRQAGKAANFGFPGMMGAAKFVTAKRREGFKVCEWFHRDGRCGEEKVMVWNRMPLDRRLCLRCLTAAQKMKQTYANVRWTEMPEYWAWVTNELDANGDKMAQLHSGLVRGGMTPPAAANNQFQGLAALAAKKAVLQLTEEMYQDNLSPLFGSRLVIFAHDETIIEAPLEKCHEAGYRQATVMVEEARKVVKDVKIKAEPAAMLNWYKDAEPVFKEGKLVPWQPSLQ